MDYQGIREESLAGMHIGYALIRFAARDRGAQIIDFGRFAGVARFPDLDLLTHSYRRFEGALGAAWVDDKLLTNHALADHGIAVARATSVSSVEELPAAAEEIGFPLVVKPRVGSRGRGVIVGVRTMDDLVAAFHSAAEHHPDVLIEEQLEIAVEYRIMASATRYIGAVERTLPRVIGDGSSTIATLIEQKNRDRLLNPALANKPVPVDDVLLETLTAQGLTLHSVLAAGREVDVRNIGGLSGGGDSRNVTDLITPELRDLSTRAIRAIPGLFWAGIDVAIDAHTGVPHIIELNVNAGYSGIEFPSLGEPTLVSPVVFDLRLEDARRRRAIYESVEAAGSPPPPVPTRYEASDVPEHLSTLYGQFLERNGYTVAELSPTVNRASNGTDHEFYCTGSFRTADDLSVWHKYLTRHSFIRRILRDADIPRPRARLASFPLKDGGVEFSPTLTYWAVPRNAGWLSPESQQVIFGEGPPPLTGAYSIQSVPRGARYRVFASRTRAFTGYGLETSSPVAPELEVELRDLAVTAVSAVPEIRWAAVDVVVLGNGRVLVEGVSTFLEMLPDEAPLFGSLDEFFAWFTHYSRLSPLSNLNHPAHAEG